MEGPEGVRHGLHLYSKWASVAPRSDGMAHQSRCFTPTRDHQPPSTAFCYDAEAVAGPSATKHDSAPSSSFDRFMLMPSLKARAPGALPGDLLERGGGGGPGETPPPVRTYPVHREQKI